MTFDSVLAGLGVGPVITALILAAVPMAMIGFVLWAGKKVGRFFG